MVISLSIMVELVVSHARNDSCLESRLREVRVELTVTRENHPVELDPPS